MTAQRIEIELPFRDERSGTRAMTKAAETNGVRKVEVLRERNLLVVSGVGVDCVDLANSLKKKFGFARIVSVRSLNSESSMEEESRFGEHDFRQRRPIYDYNPTPYYNYNPTPYYNYYQQPTYIAKPVQDLDPPMCSIM